MRKTIFRLAAMGLIALAVPLTSLSAGSAGAVTSSTPTAYSTTAHITQAQAALRPAPELVTIHVVKANATPEASGGGCSSKSYTNFGWISACISASVFNVIPNVYVGITGSPGPGCYVQIRLLTNDGDVVTSTSAPCSDGNHEGYISTQYLGTYYTNGVLANDLGQRASVDSPTLSMP
jgi:hypothetical protein